MRWIYPVLLRKGEMRWAGTALVTRFGAYKKGLIEAFQSLIFNGITIMPPRFGIQAAVPGFPVHRYAAEAAFSAFECLKSYLIVIALGK
jgi:hypothetical protein